jgi:hypothetical protein
MKKIAGSRGEATTAWKHPAEKPIIDLWAILDSNQRLPACKAGALYQLS